MAVIMICAARPAHQDADRVAAALRQAGYRVESFPDQARFLEAAVARPPALVVYALGPSLEDDLGVLRLLKRAQPDVSVIVMTEDPSLRTRAAVQPLRPVFFSVDPTDPEEVLEVVRETIRRRARPG
jgi:DNA-binding response OmpR family regulator